MFGSDIRLGVQAFQARQVQQPQPVTQEELEHDGQLRLRLRPFSPEEEQQAVAWCAQRKLEAEVLTDNPQACQQPANYLSNQKARLLANEAALELCVGLWRKAKASNALDEPVWKQRPVSPLRVIRRRAAAVA